MERRSARLRLRVAPGARRAGVVGRFGDAWKIRVVAAPERGRANEEVLDVLARSLDVPRVDVRVVSGSTSRDKVVELSGLTSDEAERRLEAAGREHV